MSTKIYKCKESPPKEGRFMFIILQSLTNTSVVASKHLNWVRAQGIMGQFIVSSLTDKPLFTNEYTSCSRINKNIATIPGINIRKLGE